MAELLVVNSGSSSLKLSLFSLIKGRAVHLLDTTKFQEIKASSIKAIGHRIVHGGEKTVRITAEVERKLKRFSALAPLHQAKCLEGIQACKKLFKGVPQYAVFDTAFHAKMPAYASHYAIPPKWKIRRYGFHGIAHEALYLAHPKKKLITLHLGSGCSICAIKNGISIDTSMGFTPLEGLVMGTRSGDIDPSVLEYVCKTKKWKPAEVIKRLNEESGLLAFGKNHLGEDLFRYRIIKYIGSYLAALQGIDALIFSGGKGENLPDLRSHIIEAFAWLGWKLDPAKNKVAVQPRSGQKFPIQEEGSTIEILVIGSRENQTIADQILNKIFK